MKIIIFSLIILISSLSYANKITIPEMKDSLSKGDGLISPVDTDNLSDLATCSELRAFLIKNHVVAKDENGSTTDISNVVICVD